MKKKLSLLMVALVAITAFAVQVSRRAATEVANIAALNVLENGAEFNFTGEALVVYQNGNYVYVKDDTGSTLIYKKDVVAANSIGKTIEANWTGKVSIFNKLFEVVPDAETLTLKEGDPVTVTYPEATIADVTVSNVNKIVKLTDVTIASVAGKDFKIKKGDLTVAGYNQFAVEGLASGLVCTEMVGAISVYNDAIQFQPISFTVGTPAPDPVDVTISPASGDISAALAEATALCPAKNITINLTANGEYTLSAPVEGHANVIINGPETLAANQKAPVINAEANTGAFVKMGTPVVVANSKNFYEVDNFAIKNVVVKNVNSYLYDDNKNAFAFAEFAVENCVFEFTNTKQDIDAPFRFQAGGPVKFVLKNNTMYQKGTKNNRYFVKIGSGNFPDKAFDAFAGPYVWDIENNTFYQAIAHGEGTKMAFINGGRVANNFQKTSITILKNIIVDCAGSESFWKDLFGGKSSDSDREKFVAINTDYNTYWTDGAAINVSKYDKGENTIASDPQFKDAATDDFTLALTSAQNVAKTGDPRWLVYAVTVADDIQNGTVVADVAAAKAGETVTLTATPAEGYELDAISVRGVTSDELVGVNDGKFTMPADAVTVSATFKPAPVDVEIAAADITEGKLTDAIVAKAADKPIKNLTVTLAENTDYTVTAPIEVAGNVNINGAAGAKIDASALTAPFIKMAEISANAPLNDKGAYVIDGITIKDVTITGLPYQLIYGNKQKYLMSKILVENSVIGINGTAKKTIFDFNGGGNASEIIVNNSTLWANPSNEQNGGLFSSQSGHGSIQDLGSDKQLFAITNSTIYNIAYGRTTNSQRRNNTAGMEYKVENSIIVNSGKSGQFIVGLNGGSANSAQTYTVNGNVFNFDDADVSAAEQAKVQEKIAEFAMTSINGVVAFTDAANGDFNGTFKLPIGAVIPEAKVGDPRWNVTYKESGVVLWSSEEPATIGWGEANITVAAEKFANAKVGDVMHVALQDIPAEAANPWDAQVELRGQNWKALEGAAFVAAPAKTAADFVLTGDILAIAKAQGIQINGTNCKTNLITLEYADKVAGSDASIWVGTATKENVILNKAHFANSNLFGGVKVGDKIRLTVKKTDPEGGEWIGLNYQTPSWVWSDFAEGSFATTITQTEEGAIIDFEVKTAEVAQILNADNAQIIVNNPNQTVTQVELIVAPVDIEISPADGDIAAALKAETDKVAKVGKITINLTKDVTYTVGATLVAPNSITINGNGAIIDASALEANMIQWTNIDAAATWTKADVSISGVTVKGLKKALFFSNSKYYYGDFSLINSVVEQAGDATTFDYTKGSVAINFMVSGSTIYAPTATTKSLYSSQGGQKATEYKDDATQSFAFLLNTMYNLAKGKNFFSHRQSNQKWLAYGVQSNIFVNCGKSGQVIKGMNGGQSGANPTWAISGNAFNFEGADTSADESTGDDEEPVKESVAGVMTFANVETPDFGGTFEMPAGATAPTALGDPRWTITYTNVLDKLYIMGNGTTGGWDATTEMTFNEQTQAFEYTLEVPAGGAWFTFGDAAFEGNWDDFNANHRYAIGEGDVDATIGEALPLVKVNGTLAIKTAGTYNISVAKNLSTVTITSTGTGINSIAADKMKNATIYTVSGQRVEKAQKGLYIIDGKKVVVK